LPALNVPSLSWRGSPIVTFAGVPSGRMKSTLSMSSGFASMIQTKQLNVPHDELPFFVFEIRTPWPGVNESLPTCWTASTVYPVNVGFP
jgi:hypothetical protein